MVDTVRTYAALQALLADNTAGDISPQDLRDFLVTAGVYGRWPTVTQPEDTYWLGTDYADDFTQVTISGVQTVIERVGLLSVKFSGQTSGDYNAALKPHAFSIGDAWTVPLGLFALASGATGGQEVGIVFADGAASTSNVVMGTILSSSGGGNNFQLVGREGTLDTIASTPWVSDAVVIGTMLPFVVVRLTYSAADTFTLEFSPDGVNFTTFGEADISQVLTPTHVGVCWSESTVRPEAIVTFGPLLYTPS